MFAASPRRRRVPWLLRPFYALWRLLTWIVSLTGRLIAVILGLVIMIAGILVSITIVGLPVGIPLVIIGFLLMIRGLF
jgi:uncharacterized membrane protein HdeD (DUF308 family)